MWGGIAQDNRRFINGVFWILRTGAPWRDLPPDYGDWKNTTDVFADGGIRVFGKNCWNHFWKNLYLKRWRGIATRYAKNAASFLAAIHIRCIALAISASLRHYLVFLGNSSGVK